MILLHLRRWRCLCLTWQRELGLHPVSYDAPSVDPSYVHICNNSEKDFFKEIKMVENLDRFALNLK